MNCRHGHETADCPDARCRGELNSLDALADFIARRTAPPRVNADGTLPIGTPPSTTLTEEEAARLLGRKEPKCVPCWDTGRVMTRSPMGWLPCPNCELGKGSSS